jgi:hypothetical protein
MMKMKLVLTLILFLLLFLHIPGSVIAQEESNIPAVEGAVEEIPSGFRTVQMGMDIDAVKEALIADGNFSYRGDPDISLLPSPNEYLIEVRGRDFIRRAYFQFYDRKLYIIILVLNPDLLGHFTMYTTFVEKFGEPLSLSPIEVVWESELYRLSLERPLSIKYLDIKVFEALLQESRKLESLGELSREQFLEQF